MQPHADSDISAEDSSLAKFFHIPMFGHFDQPSTVLDMHGWIMLWYLSFIFYPDRIVSLFIANTICASGVPTGNGELAKSQFSCSWPVAKDIIHWPMASLSNQILFDWDTNRIK